MTLRPIGIFHSHRQQRYEAPRQTEPSQLDFGYIDFLPGQQFEQALDGVEEFERIWIIFQFHLNQHWKPMVRPPRGPSQKRGVFSTRAPYRPNPIGLSCVRIHKREGLRLWIESSDLLDGTPILDIKPYLPYADAFPNAKPGWIDGIENEKFDLLWSDLAEEQRLWLEKKGVLNLWAFAQQQLEYDPFDSDRKRVSRGNESSCGVLAYRTWRLHFRAVEKTIHLNKITSGYSSSELKDPQDEWKDKSLHREFLTVFQEDDPKPPS